MYRFSNTNISPQMDGKLYIYNIEDCTSYKIFTGVNLLLKT